MVCDMWVFISLVQYEEWNAHSRKLLGYIQTRNKPPIFYLPAQQNSDTEELVKKTRAKFEGNVSLSPGLPLLSDDKAWHAILSNLSI